MPAMVIIPVLCIVGVESLWSDCAGLLRWLTAPTLTHWNHHGNQ